MLLSSSLLEKVLSMAKSPQELELLYFAMQNELHWDTPEAQAKALYQMRVPSKNDDYHLGYQEGMKDFAKLHHIHYAWLKSSIIKEPTHAR